MCKIEDEVIKIIANFSDNIISDEEVITWATSLLENGHDTKSIIELAGLQKYEYENIVVLLKNIVSELGLEYPNKYILKMYRAKSIAEDIVNGNIRPNKGCDLIHSISIDLDRPKELSSFDLLSHEQSGHDHLGITANKLIPDIMSASKELIKNFKVN
jgi:hypothetical protein